MATSTLTRPRGISSELERFRRDFPYYAEKCLTIRTKSAKVQQLKLNRAQRTVHEFVQRQLKDTGRIRAIVLKARQEGVSTYVAARNFRRVNLYSNQTCLVIADQQKRASVLFDIYDMYHRHLPENFRPMKRYASRKVLWYDKPTGRGGLNSKVTVETAKDADVGRASTIQALHASEFAFWDHAETVWVSLAQAVPDEGSEIWVESTANGVGNLFHQMWEEAKAGENGYVPIFLPWWYHTEEYQVRLTPGEAEDLRDGLTDYERELVEEGAELDGVRYNLTLEQIAWRRQTIRDKLQGDERAFRQEYPATDREAFLTSGNCFFEDELLLEYERHTKVPSFRGNLIKHHEAIITVPGFRGPLRVWEPPQEEAQYVIFADTATGKLISPVERGATFELSESELERGGRDFSCADVLKVATLKRKDDDQWWEPCRTYVAQLHGRIVPEEFAKLLRMLGFYYANPKADVRTTREPALIGVERNHSSGETVIRLLKDSAYPRLFYARTINNRMNKITQQAGWVTTEASRQIMLDEFAQGLRDGSIVYPNSDGIREMFTFIRNERGRPEAQEGCHDDRVLAAAGAFQMARYHPLRRKTTPPRWERANTPTGHMDYR